MSVALAHQRADRGGGSVEDVDLVLFAYGPEAIVIWIVRNAFEHQGGRPIQQRTVDDVAVPGDPPDICSAPENLAFTIIEDVTEGGFGPDGISAGGMQNALGFACRT